MDRAEAVLGSVPEPMAELGRDAYRLLLELYPDAVVTVDGGDIGFGATTGYKGLVFTLSPHSGHITLGIANGALLPDPDGLLEGRGEVHRHVTLRTRADLDDPRLRLLLSAALLAQG